MLARCSTQNRHIPHCAARDLICLVHAYTCTDRHPHTRTPSFAITHSRTQAHTPHRIHEYRVKRLIAYPNIGSHASSHTRIANMTQTYTPYPIFPLLCLRAHHSLHAHTNDTNVQTYTGVYLIPSFLFCALKLAFGDNIRLLVSRVRAPR